MKVKLNNFVLLLFLIVQTNLFEFIFPTTVPHLLMYSYFAPDTPGPGAYDDAQSFKNITQKAKYKKSPETIGLRYKMHVDEETPSPLTYNPHRQCDAPGFSMPKSLKPEYWNANPAPNQYNAQVIDTSPMVTIGPKVSQSKISDVPGPGRYCPEKNMTSSPSKSIGIRCDIDNKNNNPGPNQYIQDNKSLTSLKQQQKTIAPKYPLITDKPTPGVGSYNIAKPTTIGNPITISGEHKELFNTNLLANPGVGTYHQRYSQVEKQAPAVTMGVKTRIELDNENPAPNMYSLGDSRTQVGFSFPKDVKHDSIIQQPGPNHYQIKTAMTKESARAQSLAFRYPDLSEVERSPGPKYQIRQEIDMTKGVSLASRHELNLETNPIVGPGRYDTEITCVKKVRAMSMGFRHQQNVGNTNPGAGQYNVNRDTFQKSGAGTFGMRTKRCWRME